MFSVTRFVRTPRRIRRTDALVSAATGAALLACMVPHLADGASGTTGKWTQDVDWRGTNSAYAIHLVLLPGDGPPHSRLLFWSGYTEDAG